MPLVFEQWPIAIERIFRVGFGVLLSLQLIATLPHVRRFMVSETFGGYLESSRWRDRIWHPVISNIVAGVWLLAALGITLDVALVPAALINLALARYFFVDTRWSGILRGMGAPGHMTYWMSALTALLAIAPIIDSTGRLRGVAVLAFRVDYALIMFMAGIYKLSAGYARGDGFERGLVNPWWGWWHTRLRRLSPHTALFRVLNHLGWSTEVICGILFLIPLTAPYAAVVFALSFLMIGAAIRLTYLAEMVALGCLIFVYPDSFAARLTVPWVSSSPQAVAIHSAPPWVVSCCIYGIVAYLALLPWAYLGMCVNFYFRRRLTWPLQRALDLWTRAFGLILWRVFTSDVINFYVVLGVRRIGSTDIARYPEIPSFGHVGRRFLHVGEFICLASIFTTLKYYPDDRSLFQQRLLRYVRTLCIPNGSEMVFDYHSVVKRERFAFPRVARFVVNSRLATVEQELFNTEFNVHAAAVGSPVFPGASPGSYAPKHSRVR